MLGYSKYQTLGQIIDTTWGVSSIEGKVQSTKMYKLPQYSIKMKIVDEGTLRCVFTTIITYADKSILHNQLQAHADQSAKVTDDIIKQVKKLYKKDAGETLKLKSRVSNVSFEMVNMSPHSPKRTGCYRRETFFDIL
jgi:hypothetical protein